MTDVLNVKCRVKVAFFLNMNTFELDKNIYTGNWHIGILSMEKYWSVWVVAHMVKSWLELRAILGIFQPWPIFMQQ